MARSPTTVLRRPPGAEPHQNLGADPHRAEAPGQAIGPGVELGVRERFAGSDERDGLWPPLGLLLDPAVDEARRARVCPSFLEQQAGDQFALLLERQFDAHSR